MGNVSTTPTQRGGRTILFHYIHAPPGVVSDEEKAQWAPGGEAVRHAARMSEHGHDVLAPVDRTRQGNNDTKPIKDMKTTWFSFLAYNDDCMWVRRYTCNCSVCEAAGIERVHLGSRYENYKTCGPWVKFVMTNHSARHHGDDPGVAHG